MLFKVHSYAVLRVGLNVPDRETNMK